VNDTIVSLIRTWVPVAVGAVVAWVVRKLGWVTPDTTELATAFTAIVIAAYYALARWLEKKWPVLGVLLGIPKQPAYAGVPPAGPAPTA
jgi:hypothetical protein